MVDALGAWGVEEKPSRGIMYGSRALAAGGAINGAATAMTRNAASKIRPATAVGLRNSLRNDCIAGWSRVRVTGGLSVQVVDEVFVCVVMR